MIEKFKDLLRKKAKEGKFLDENSKKAKEEMLDEIDEIMNEKGQKELKGLKKVTVAAPTEEGLKEGLDKAKDIIGNVKEIQEEISTDSMEEENIEEENMEEECDIDIDKNKKRKLEKLMDLISQLKE